MSKLHQGFWQSLSRRVPEWNAISKASPKSSNRCLSSTSAVELEAYFHMTIGLPVKFTISRNTIRIRPAHSISMGAKPIYNLLFADIDLMAGINKTFPADCQTVRGDGYWQGQSRDLGEGSTVQKGSSFKYLGAKLSKDDSCKTGLRQQQRQWLGWMGPEAAMASGLLHSTIYTSPSYHP